MDGKERARRPDATDKNQPLSSTIARRRGRPQKGQSESLTQAIVDVAADLFMSNGFRATSMDAIAARTGSSKRTLYARFPSKLHLFEEVMQRFAQARLAIFGQRDPGSETFDAFLTRIAHDMLAQAVDAEGIAMFRLLVAEGYRFPELKVIGHERLVEPMTRALTEALTGAIARGDIVDRDPAFLAEQFIEAVCGREVRRIAFGYEEAGMTEQRLARVDLAVDLYLQGIRVRAAEEGRHEVRDTKRVSARGGA
ncbi:TetR/AcrR family transcriptional regulator [Aureimonas sp. AU12]|uniref:TetR/AcrR family transcriptional regulator n=1 Tax=Aureimonas sp. AU12 TaxID=1638161 RepID=UPI00244E8064|nr:TetR/AcrR family transcriptional regulator [Aureimonas sp. AU12]